VGTAERQSRALPRPWNGSLNPYYSAERKKQGDRIMNRLSCPLLGLTLGFLVMVLLGCASTPPTRFFVLSPVSGFEKMGNREGERCFAIGIGPVKIPEYLNQPEIVTRITQNEVRLDEFVKWAEPLENNISRALAENLPSLLCIRTIAIFPWRTNFPRLPD
jgi:uncharacterized lipoprotein YmbA